MLHAITRCDTVSALYRIGKRKPFNLLHTKREHGMLNLFLNSDSTHEEIQLAGESFLLKLYGRSKCASLDELRYICYKKAFFILPVGNIASNKCRSQTTFVSNISHGAGMEGEVFTANRLGMETRGHPYSN